MEGKELAVQDPFMRTIETLAANKDVDVDKLRQIMEMQEHILDRNAEQAFNAAMVRAQAEMPVVPRDKKNEQTNSMYSKYETILIHCKPIYTKHGFSVLFHEGDAKRENEIRIIAEVMHEQGHTKTVWTDIPLDDTGIKGSVNKTKTHAKGSSIQYGRGYLMRQIFNIPSGDDDDGNTAGGQHITEEQVNVLHALIHDNIHDESYEPKFLKFMKAESIETIKAKDFQKARAAIQAAISRLKHGA